MHRRLRGCLVLLALAAFARAQNLEEFSRRVTEFTLANGLHFIVLERHQAPVVSFHTYVHTGSVDDPKGQTGIAHMFEHMAFKGTNRIGTRDYTAEAQALEAVERAYDRLEARPSQPAAAGAPTRDQLQRELTAAIEKANSFVEPNAYPRIIEENGAAGLNASTGEEATEYYYSLPANRAELWFLLESERFLHPVFREFYKERDVVREERRMRVESSPEGKLMELLLASAFLAHSYRQPTAGWASDIEHLRVRDARAFFDAHYVPANITIAIAGDIDPAQVKRLAGKYFGPLASRPLPPPLYTVEPRQEGPRRAAVETPSQPELAIVYKRPDQKHADDPVFDVVGGLLDAGRTGMLYRDLVRDRQLALGASTSNAFPGGLYPNVFLIWVTPAPGHNVEENERAVYAILEHLKSQPVEAQALARVKTRLRAALIRQLDSNAGMASELAYYHANYGNWKKLFTGLADIDRVTADDVRRVARTYFTESARTVVYTVPAPGETR
jgi:predicted Zn-dependent peptidase